MCCPNSVRLVLFVSFSRLSDSLTIHRRVFFLFRHPSFHEADGVLPIKSEVWIETEKGFEVSSALGELEQKVSRLLTISRTRWSVEWSHPCDIDLAPHFCTSFCPSETCFYVKSCALSFFLSFFLSLFLFLSFFLSFSRRIDRQTDGLTS